MKNFRKSHRFTNPHIEHNCRSWKDFFYWGIGKYSDKQEQKKPPEGFELPSYEDNFNHKDSFVRWINHSTFTVHHADLIFMTDPIWASRASPLSFIGPKRKHPAPVDIEDIGELNFVLISHNHYDHLDRATVIKLNRFYPDLVWFVPRGLSSWFKKLRVQKVVELDWWEENTQVINRTKVSVTAVPAQHFSGRGIWDTNKTLWAGFVVEIEKPFSKTKRFFFAGDTGYNQHDFKKIGKRFGRMDLSLLPIGAYVPRKFQKNMHINPQEAIQIHKDVGSRLSVGCHWHTFKISAEDPHRPAYDLLEELKNQNLHSKDFRLLLPGEKLNW